MAEHNRFLAVSDDSHIILLFCDLLDSGIAGIEQYIVDGSGEEAEYYHQYAKDKHVLNDVDEGDYVLKDEEWLCHDIE